MRNWWMLVAVLLPLGCGGKKKGPESADDVRTKRNTEIKLEKCDVASSGAESIDANGDGKPDVIKVMSGDREVCRVVDLNFDGRTDRTTFFDVNKKIRRIESDFDRDGRVDEIVLFEGGVIKEKHRATTLDGKLDTWEFYEKGQVARTERDENGDGIIDQWWEYPAHGCPLIHVDADGDGRPDPGASIDYCKETGYVPPPVPGEAADRSLTDFGRSTERVEEIEDRSSDAPANDAPANDAPTDAGSEQ